jgi:hypothetical protein
MQAWLLRRLTNRHVRCPSVVRPLSVRYPSVKEYLSIFKHILENIQRICQLHPIANGHVRPSVRHVLIRRLYSMSIIYDNPGCRSMIELGSFRCIFCTGTQRIVLPEAPNLTWTRAACGAAETGHHWMQLDSRIGRSQILG